MELKIKDAFKARYVGFRGSNGKKLGDLNQTQLQSLALIGRQSGDQSILGLFTTEVPSAEALQKAFVEKQTAPLKQPAKPASDKGK